MYKILKKEFLLGLGIGFIISAMVVWAYGPRELSDQEIKDRAARLGMVEQAVPSGRIAGDNTGQGRVPTGSAGGVKNAPATTGQTAAEGTQANPRSITVTITSGMGSEEIARQLEEKGAVPDDLEFLRVVTAHKAHTRFQNGTFTFPAGTDMDEIVRILTGRK